jgi:hypothetical protein
MKITDIANGSEVKIHASINKHNVVLLTQAIFGVSAGLLVRPMEYFGKYMQFMEPSQVEIRNKRDGRVYKFMSTTITPVKTRYGKFHLIRCSSAIEPENSRRAERFNIEKLGLFAVNGNTTALKNCIVHDISMRGMSLIIDNATKCRVGDKLDISFRYGELLHNYEVSAVVVRMFAVQNKPALGCSISNMNVDLIGLLSKKRQEKYPELVAENETNINPEISEEQQIKEVEEDLASQLKSGSSGQKRITETNPFDPDKLEHVQLDSDQKSLRQKKRDEKIAAQSREIENLLDLRDI